MLENPKIPLKKIDKPWGYELLWAETTDYVGKVLVVLQNQSLSLQFHERKEETLFIESGECWIEYGPDKQSLKKEHFAPGEVFHIPPKLLHRITAITETRIFEVSTPHLTDVVRLEDRYGRR